MRCEACGEDNPIALDFLHELFTFKFGFSNPELRPRLDAGELFDKFKIGIGGQYFARHGFRQPTCSGCALATDLTRMPPGAMTTVPCARCATVMTSHPVPDWLHALAPHAVQIFTPGLVSVVTPETRPVVLACPECGGKLKVGAEDRRIVVCGFCESSVFLPEGVWHAFHPAKKRPTWYIAFNAAREV